MPEAIAITNVKVFDGNALTEERTVVIDNGVISDALMETRPKILLPLVPFGMCG